MNHKIRNLAVYIALIFCSFSASSQQDGKFKVVTTFTIIADMASNVAGDAAIVESITKPNAEIHNYQPTPRDILRAHNADLVLYNGMNLELWFAKFFIHFKAIPSVVISKNVTPIGITQGPYSGKPNPHAWMSPNDALIYVNNIRDALIKYDPQHESTYRANADDYAKKITATVEPFRNKLKNLPADKRWLVTSEGAFSYLARDFGLKELYLWPINADSQGTPQQVRHVIDQVRSNNISVVFSESTISANPAKQVARETDANYGGVLYVDSLSNEHGLVPTYLDLLRVTLTTITTGVSQ